MDKIQDNKKNQDQKKINVAPTKTFFIQTLVKDIHLADAVLDLIDNSIDAYIKSSQKECIIKISFSKNQFTIEDNCRGIKKEKVYDQIFRLGALVDEDVETIGVFGIGMKRALFKIGQEIFIESDDGKDFFSIKIDEAWLKNEDEWKLKFEEERKTKGKAYTKITIKKIFEGISEELNSTTFENGLISRIKDTYSLFIERGVTIKVNGTSVEPYEFKFLNDNKNFVPLHRKYSEAGVEIEFYAGYTPIQKRDEDKIYGWYIFCNDRLVIKNDVSEKTGWGDSGDRKYHYPEDDRFLGLLFLRSKKSRLLPWHTTKEDVQEDSKIYKKVKIEMREIKNKFVDLIKIAAKTKDPETGETIGNSIFKNVPLTQRKEIQKISEGILPKIKGEKIEDIPQETSIQYYKKTALVKKVKKKLGEAYMSNKEAGEKTFDYFVKMEGIANE